MDPRERLREWVSWVGSQEQAGERAGCHQTTISKMLRGENPGLALACRLEEATADWPHGPIAAREWVVGAPAPTGTDGG